MNIRFVFSLKPRLKATMIVDSMWYSIEGSDDMTENNKVAMPSLSRATEHVVHACANVAMLHATESGFKVLSVAHDNTTTTNLFTLSTFSSKSKNRPNSSEFISSPSVLS